MKKGDVVKIVKSPYNYIENGEEGIVVKDKTMGDIYNSVKINGKFIRLFADNEIVLKKPSTTAKKMK